MRWRHHSGQVALVRNGRKDLHSQWNDARPDGERIIFLIVLGTAGAYLGRGFAERQRQYGRRLEFLRIHRTQDVPAALVYFVDESFEPRLLLDFVNNLMSIAFRHHRAVIGRMVEGRARQDKTVDYRDGHAHLGTIYRFEHPAGGGAVPIDVIALPPLQRRGDIWRAVEHITDMADGHCIENCMNGFGIVAAALAQPPDADALAGSKRFGHERIDAR